MSTSLNTSNSETVITVPYIYKIFKITDIEVLSAGDINTTIIYYRFSQDYGRTTSKWVELTLSNLKSERINPIRFFQIEYLASYLGTSSVTIFDINLIGDFQNVTLDGTKSNVYGIREDCNSLMLSIIGDTTTYPGPMPPGGASSMLMPPYTQTSVNLPTLTADDISKLYNPYQQAQGLTLFNKLANDAVLITGHDVIYVLTDPDKKGIDFTFHEYQLHNYICQDQLKVTVDNNQFPENNGAINNYDLLLFDQFEIQITKDQFKAAFGIEKRPSINDVIWFCDLNKLYTIEHSQALRTFNNYSIYYKIILKKFNKKASIIGATEELQSIIDGLTHNSTIEELIGLENMQDKKAVSMTEQFRTAAQDILRLNIYANIESEDIENASVIVSKQHYELSTITAGSNAVVYNNFKYFYKVSDNIGYMCWFSMNTVDMISIFNFFNYYDVNNNGIIIQLIGNNLIVIINNLTHVLNLSNSTSNVLQPNVWYSLVVNLDQRQSVLNTYIYKRNVQYEQDAVMLTSSNLLLLYKISLPIIPTVIEMDNLNASILASDMKITNIRMFLDVIPESDHNKMLNRATVGSDYKYIIFADHATKDVVLPFNEDSKVNYNKNRTGTGFSN